MQFKSVASHGSCFLAGLGIGLLLATKACPPVPAPAAAPHIEEPSKIDVKVDTKAPATIEVKSEPQPVKPEEGKNGAVS